MFFLGNLLFSEKKAFFPMHDVLQGRKSSRDICLKITSFGQGKKRDLRQIKAPFPATELHFPPHSGKIFFLWIGS